MDASRPLILTVEDDELVLAMMQELLISEGFAVMGAPGNEAYETARQRRPDLVLLDVMLQDLDCEAVAADLRRLHGDDLPILLVTAVAPELAMAEAQAVGAFACLWKPFDIDELVKLVRQGLLLRRSVGMPEVQRPAAPPEPLEEPALGLAGTRA